MYKNANIDDQTDSFNNLSLWNEKITHYFPN